MSGTLTFVYSEALQKFDRETEKIVRDACTAFGGRGGISFNIATMNCILRLLDDARIAAAIGSSGPSNP